jgi:hypothetical protein
MQIDRLKRREFLILLGGATVGWPGAAIAEAPSKVYRVGLLSATAPVTDRPGSPARWRSQAQREASRVQRLKSIFNCLSSAMC